MNSIVWNCRGAGNASTVRDIVALTRAHSPSMVFLCETRQQKDKMYRLRNRIGLRGFEGVSSEGNSGGLALFWDESLYVDMFGCLLMIKCAELPLHMGSREQRIDI